MRCIRFWKHVMPIVAALAACMSVLMILRFGCPQWNRCIYIFQAHVSPRYERGVILAPPSYEGVWRGWYGDGTPRFMYTQHNGNFDGRSLTWHENGRLSYEGWYKGGRNHGISTNWDDRGRVISSFLFVGGRQVTREEYLAACAKDPTLPKPPDDDTQLNPPSALPRQNDAGSGARKE